MKYTVCLLSVLSIANIEYSGAECPPPCSGGGPNSWMYITLLSMGPTEPGQGYIDISVDWYSTTQDACKNTIEYQVERDCRTEEIMAKSPGPKSNMCGVICGDPSHCPDINGCIGCPGLFTHFAGWYTMYIPLAGKGTFQVLFNGNVVFSQYFDFGGIPEYFEMEFTNIEFTNKNGTHIIYDDVFDASESVGLEVIATFLGDAPAPAISVVLKSTLNADSLITILPLDEQTFQTAYYRGILGEGAFLPLVGDPEEALPPYTTAEIIAYPIPFECGEQPPEEVPEDRLTIANYYLRVKEISFIDDYEIYKDGLPPTPNDPPPPILIIDPVWVDSPAKNDPAAYRRLSAPKMNVVLENSHLPKHDFAYRVKGVGWAEQQRYSTGIYEGHFNYGLRDTVFNIVPVDGRFPDSVGIVDPLTYRWFVNKAVYYNPLDYNYLNATSTKIFLTYHTPLVDSPRVLALDKICGYAQNEYQPAVIAEKGVSGVYAEGWDYDPGDVISLDPLDVIRNHNGQCGDYANLLTYMYRSIGVAANSVIIYNSEFFAGHQQWLYWYYTGEIGFRYYLCLLTKTLTSCSGKTMQWKFRYHAVARCDNYLCDASFGLFKTVGDYSAWWKYYLWPKRENPPYSHGEPPGDPPTYYDWYYFIPNSGQIIPGAVEFNSYFYHPYGP